MNCSRIRRMLFRSEASTLRASCILVDSEPSIASLPSNIRNSFHNIFGWSASPSALTRFSDCKKSAKALPILVQVRQKMPFRSPRFVKTERALTLPLPSLARATTANPAFKSFCAQNKTLPSLKKNYKDIQEPLFA